MKTWIKDLQSGNVREYGSDQHDSLMISQDGRTLSYYNMQCGDGSIYGDFRFVTGENGLTPEEDTEAYDAYFNIGGWQEIVALPERTAMERLRDRIESEADEYDAYVDHDVARGLYKALDIVNEFLKEV